jgi:hypothetical protein
VARVCDDGRVPTVTPLPRQWSISLAEQVARTEALDARTPVERIRAEAA